MYVLIGTDKAIEGYRDPNSDDPDAVRYRDLPGERIVQFDTPSDWSLQEAFNTLLLALPLHLAKDAVPVWVESDSDGLIALISEHFQLGKSSSSRPRKWGEDTGANLMPTPGDNK